MAKGKNSTSKRKRRSRRKHVKIDAKSIAEALTDEIIEALGIGYLDLSDKEKREVAIAVVEELTSSISYKPSKSALLTRISRLRIRLAPLISEKLLELRKELSEDMLDYIVNYGGPVAAANVRRLYNEAKRSGREDLIGVLRSVWETYGRPLPVKCPNCGFSATQPNLICFVCGRRITPEELKEAIDFESLLEMFIDIATPDDVKRLEENQAIIYDPEEGLKTRRGPLERIQYVIPLSKSELDTIIHKIEEKYRPKPKIVVEIEKIEKVAKALKEEAKKVEEKRKREIRPTLDMFLRGEEK